MISDLHYFVSLTFVDLTADDAEKSSSLNNVPNSSEFDFLFKVGQCL